MRSFYVKEENIKYEGTNAYKAISSFFPSLSVGNLNKVFRLKDVKVNKKRIDKDYILNKGDFVEVYLSDELLLGTTLDLNIIYEDENILAVYKNSKIQTCNESHVYSDNEKNVYLEQLVRNKKGENIHVCHRLDTNTEGIVLFSKNEITHDELIKAFKNHNITKKYLAFVYNKPPKAHEILTAYLEKKDNNTVKIYDKQTNNSVKIITEYSLLDYFNDKNIALLDVTLHTGKMHQIRAHMKHIGCPIIGDPKYSTNEINRKFNKKTQVLYSYKYQFEFNQNSVLSYLNNIEISLDYTEIVKREF